MVVNGNSTLESPKHHSTTNGIVVTSANGSSAGVSSAATNGTSNSAGSANSAAVVAAATNGAIKPKGGRY